MRYRAMAVVAIFVASQAGAAGEPVPITACGQAVPPGGVGVLMNDIVCPPWGVCYPSCPGSPCSPLEPPTPCRVAADCPDPDGNTCSAPPGGEPSVGVYVGGRGRLEMDGHGVSGAYTGIRSGAPGELTDSGRVTLVGPGAITGNRDGIHVAGMAKVTGLSIDDNEIGLVADRANVRDVQGTGNGALLFIYRSARATGLTATLNDYGVLSYGTARLLSSTITGSWLIDILTLRRPRVVQTTCGQSAGLVETGQPGIYAPGPTWGVCSGD